MTTTTSKTPSHYIYAVTKRDGAEKGHWTQIGAAWPNADGKGFNIDLALSPLERGDHQHARAQGRRSRQMMLLTKAQRAKLLDNGRRQAAVKGTPDEIDFEPVVKLFNPCGAATWLLTEIDPEDETVAWGLCDLGMGFAEFGTVSLTELADYRGRLGLGIERDLHFTGARADLGLYRAANREGRIVQLSKAENQTG